jgi:preprotein translocase subunit SecY
MGASGLSKLPELRKRLLFTLLMLAIYRLGVHVPTPGIDTEALSQFFEQAQGTIFGVFNMFTGGALERFSVFALGVMPYISASIIFQLLTVVVPRLEELQKEGEQGRKKISQWTRYATVGLSLVQGYGIAVGLESLSQQGGAAAGYGSMVLEPGLGFRLLTMITLCAGTTFLMWLGEQITERGIGNGISLIIFAGIAAGIPTGIANTWALFRSGEMSAFTFLVLAMVVVACFWAIIFIERGQRRVPVQYPKRQVGNKVAAAQASHLPLKLNTSGVIPPIFASALIMFPATISTFVTAPILEDLTQSVSRPGNLVHDVIFVGLIIFFAFFYTSIVFKSEDVADNLKKAGAFVPGLRPGRRTADYLDYVLSRITLAGGVYLSIICILPTILLNTMNTRFMGGTSLLILVGVALDMMGRIEGYLIQRNQEGFVRGGKLRKGRLRRSF